jgi:hypothetical protein
MRARRHRRSRAARSAVLLGVLALGTTAPPAAAVDMNRARSLAFLRAHGGLETGNAEYVEGRWRLPVRCDVSGVSSMHQPGNVLHSGLAWWRSEAVVEGARVYLTIETRVMGPDAPSPRCGAADLGLPDAGDYEILYRDPDGGTTPIGAMRIGR